MSPDPRTPTLGGCMKKTYEKPAIKHTEEIEARAVACLKMDDMSCGGQPLTS